MGNVVPADSNKIDKALFDSLKCKFTKYTKLMNQLEVENLTNDQEDEILGEMFASSTHLNVHSGLLKKQIED